MAEWMQRLEEDFVAWQKVIVPALCEKLSKTFDPALLDQPFEPSFALEISPRIKKEKLFTGEIGHLGANKGEK